MSTPNPEQQHVWRLGWNLKASTSNPKSTWPETGHSRMHVVVYRILEPSLNSEKEVDGKSCSSSTCDDCGRLYISQFIQLEDSLFSGMGWNQTKLMPIFRMGGRFVGFCIRTDPHQQLSGLNEHSYCYQINHDKTPGRWTVADAHLRLIWDPGKDHFVKSTMFFLLFFVIMAMILRLCACQVNQQLTIVEQSNKSECRILVWTIWDVKRMWPNFVQLKRYVERSVSDRNLDMIIFFF